MSGFGVDRLLERVKTRTCLRAGDDAETLLCIGCRKVKKKNIKHALVPYMRASSYTFYSYKMLVSDDLWKV